MSLSKLRRLAAIALAAAIALVAGFLLYRMAFRQQIVTQTARHYFGQLKLNVLILGYQSDEETTDTIILAHLDVARRAATLVSIPRDTWVNVPGEGPAKINSAYAFGGAHVTAKVVSKLLGGVPIDAIVALQPEGAAAIVDALGGLDVNVDETMDYDDNSGGLHIHLKKGEQHLAGSDVAGIGHLWHRFRIDESADFNHRQARRAEPIDKGDLVCRRNRGGLVLQPITRSDFDDDRVHMREMASEVGHRSTSTVPGCTRSPA